MSDGSARFACPSCGKSYRWKTEIAGKKVRCKCGQKMVAPADAQGDAEAVGAPPQPAGDDLSEGYEIEIPDNTDLAPPQRAVPATADGACPNCNLALNPDAVLCMNCGFNLREGKVMTPEVSEMSAKDRRKAGAPLRGMKLVRVGLWLNLLSILVSVCAIAIPILVLWIGDWALILTEFTVYVAAGMSGLGALLCLAAPKESGGRPVLLVSIILSLVAGVGEAMVELEMLPLWVGLITALINIVATICFLYFFICLAQYLDFPEITERAHKVMTLYVLLLGCTLAAFIPFVGCFLIFLILGLAIYSAVLYVMLLIDLNNGLSYRISEQQD